MNKVFFEEIGENSDYFGENIYFKNSLENNNGDLC